MAENDSVQDADAKVLCLDASLRRQDGGGKRVSAFLEAVDRLGVGSDIVGVGPKGIDGVERVVASPVHKFKRHLFPIAFRRPIESELAAVAGTGPTISLVPSCNRWALERGPCWLDFPDLWSNIARNHARNVGRIPAAVNSMQARVWSRRETAEYRAAEVVSVASWSDRQQLGADAVWMPTPVSDSLVSERRTRKSEQHRPVFGMIANFDYPPNRDAYDRLVRQWLPELRPISDRIVIAGFGSEGLPRIEGIDIMGPIENIGSFYSIVDAVLAPIELGGGMKVKVVEAMMHGAAVVATAHATEGLPPAIAAECVRWGGQLSDLSDPRENPAVLGELEHFTFDTFNQEFAKLWEERMVVHD